MKIVVAAGGLSPERDVSLSSGSLIANALIDAGHSVCMVDLYTGTEDLVFFDSGSKKRYSYAVPETEPDLEALKRGSGAGDSQIGKNFMEICALADVVFLGLHGGIGENGKLQAFFDVCGIPYTGTGYIGSMLAMDKDLAKKIMVLNGIKTPDWKIAGKNGPASFFPCVVKPCGCGSSVGVSIARNETEYSAAVEHAEKYEEQVMIEKMIEGREFSVGILCGKALPIIEIIPQKGFYDYKNKYQTGLTKEICPADLPEDIAFKMQDTALRVHENLKLGSYSRVDFIVDKNNGIYCLEANTLPGMTPTSLLPQEALAAGISYKELCDKIAKMAVKP